MSRTHLFFTDVHCAPGKSNGHAFLLGKLINDIKPDVVICGGDLFDMQSLCSYDRNTRRHFGRQYADDVAAGVDFNDKLWWTVRRQKKRMPHRVFLIGNHEQRIERLVDENPELEGTIGYNNLELDSFYNTVVPYSGNIPDSVVVDGIHYAHYFVTGPSLRPISSVHLADAMVSKLGVSCVMGHTHILDFARKVTHDGRIIQAVSGGYFCNYDLEYPGYVRNSWWRGVVVLRNVDGNGGFDPEFISIKQLIEEYGGDGEMEGAS